MNQARILTLLMAGIVGTILTILPFGSTQADPPSPEDVFLDDGGEFNPDDSSAAATEPAVDDTSEVPPMEAPVAGPVADDESEEDENAPAPAPAPAKAKPAKAEKAAKIANHEPKASEKPVHQASGKKEGFRMLKQDCEMRREPASDSPVLITVKGDRKLWVEDVDDGWVKGFRQKGHGFMEKNCFE